jgi:hypothetical protein
VKDFGVPNDDMADSFSPVAGPYPEAGDDLDRLLSSGGDYLPDRLAQVARTLDALRAAPLPAELRGEDEARAAFRAIMAASRGAAPTLADETRLTDAADVTPVELTHLLPGRHRRRPAVRRVPAEDGQFPGGDLPAGRLRGSRSRGANHPSMALAAAAAAVVLAAGATLAVTLSGAGGHQPAAVGGATAQGSATTASVPAPGGVDGSGRLEPTPTPASETPSPRQLCDEFLASQGKPSSPAQQADFTRLSTLAKGSASVAAYCVQVQQLWTTPQGNGGFPGFPSPTTGPGEGQNGARQNGHDNGNGRNN